MFTPGDLVVPRTTKVEYRSDYKIQRIISIGDIHGCLLEFAALWEKLDPQPTDLVVFLGDFVDKGLHSTECLQMVRHLCKQPNVTAVLGNHEENHIRYRKHVLLSLDDSSYRNPMRRSDQFIEIHRTLETEDLVWAAGLPGIVEVIPSFSGSRVHRLYTHAGFVPGKNERQPFNKLIRNRFLHWKDGGLDAATLSEYNRDPQACMAWTEKWNEPSRVYFGHSVHNLGEVFVQNNCYGLDTGCVYGGKLTAAVDYLDDRSVEFVQVPAKRDYLGDIAEDE